MLPIGESRIELLEATSDDSPISKFLAKRGPGVITQRLMSLIFARRWLI